MGRWTPEQDKVLLANVNAAEVWYYPSYARNSPIRSPPHFLKQFSEKPELSNHKTKGKDAYFIAKARGAVQAENF